MVEPNDLVIHGWDINNLPLDKVKYTSHTYSIHTVYLNIFKTKKYKKNTKKKAMQRACVFEYGLQEKLTPYLKDIKPMKSIYYPDFIAAII